MAKIKIIAEDAGIAATAELNDCETSKKLLKILPIESHAQTWGEQVYFETKLKMPEECAHAEVDSGTIAYWPPGHAFCIFFGQEPYSPVNVMGTVEGDPKVFARVRSGDKIRVELGDSEHGPKAKTEK